MPQPDALPFAPRDTRADAARRKRLRAPADPAYTAWLHTQPCIVSIDCAGPLEQHHERSGGFNGSDADSVPLCSKHHRGRMGRHGLRSLRRFENHYRISVRRQIERLRLTYQEEHPDAVR